jgi:glycosyltransferase involved in cell wall biosynthesis
MKIAVYVSGYQPETGGGYTFENDIFEALLRRRGNFRHGFAVLSQPAAQEALARRIHDTSITVHAVSRSRLQWIFETATRALAQRHRFGRRPTALDRAMKEADADLLWFVAQPAGPQWTDYPYITTIWDVQHRVTPWFPELVADGEWENREAVNIPILQRAAAIITGTAAGQAEIERYYQVSPERVVRLPHPTPQFALNAAALPVQPLPNSFGLQRPYLFYPAQLWAHKNHLNLLLALADLKARHAEMPDLVLIGADKGNKAHILATARALGIAGNVRFLGFVSREELLGLYRHASMLVYPSWFGPENLPPLEAFALGCPVVASAIPGAVEQLGKAALLFDPANPADIAEKISLVLSDAALRSQLVAAGHTRARAWTADDYVDGVIKIVDHLEAPLRCRASD